MDNFLLRFQRRAVLLLLLLTGFVFLAGAQTIKGKVTDAKTGEPLPGAIVQAEQGSKKYTTTVNLDGSYFFRSLAYGKYELKVRSIGYHTTNEFEVVLNENNKAATLNLHMQEQSTDLKDVVIVAQASKTNDRAARGIEKNALSVVNVLSQNAIQLLPDVTVGNAMQRVSGVTIQRSTNGEGRYAIIRGMDQRYNNVLINGIKIPSPDDKYRFVPLDVFPSEMLERLEVIKALTPSMEGDAIGGTMNLVMKSAPDRFVFNINAAEGASMLFSNNRPFSAFGHAGINKLSPAEIHGNDYAATPKDFPTGLFNYVPRTSPLNIALGTTIGDRFLNGKLGVLVAASYQNFYRGSNSDFLIQNAEPYPSPANTPVLSNVYTRQYSTQTNRLGLHNKIDYVFDKNNKISLYNLLIHQNEYQTRYTADTTLITNTNAASKLVDISNRSRWTYQTVYNGTLQGEHRLSNAFNFNWSGVYSIAKNNVPDMAEYTVQNDVKLNPSGQVTRVDSTVSSMSRIWQHNTDKDLAGYLNLIYNVKVGGQLVELSLGGLYRHKTRENYYNDYGLTKSNDASLRSFHDINTAIFIFDPANKGTGNITTVGANDYSVTENITAGYIQAKFALASKLHVVGGLRIESTDQNYTTAQPLTISGKYGKIAYTDLLPSLHFKYELNDIQNLRLSYFKSISRPSFNETIATEIPGDYFNEVGNPYLKHIRADNFDLRYELFPGGADQVLLGAFYKDIKDPIEYISVNGQSVQFFKNGGPSVQYIQPQNRDKAINYGLEAQVTKFFGSFGVSANYTYTHSKITTPKLTYYKVGNESHKDTVNQTRSLQGQAQHIGNISLLYKNSKIGLDVQVALVYTGERIAQVSNFLDLDLWQHPYTQLDVSFEKRIVNKLSIYGKVNNLTNATNRVFLKHSSDGQPRALPDQEKANEILVQKDIYKISFLGGLRYKF